MLVDAKAAVGSFQPFQHVSHAAMQKFDLFDLLDLLDPFFSFRSSDMTPVVRRLACIDLAVEKFMNRYDYIILYR